MTFRLIKANGAARVLYQWPYPKTGFDPERTYAPDFCTGQALDFTRLGKPCKIRDFRTIHLTAGRSQCDIAMDMC